MNVAEFLLWTSQTGMYIFFFITEFLRLLFNVFNHIQLFFSDMLTRSKTRAPLSSPELNNISSIISLTIKLYVFTSTCLNLGTLSCSLLGTLGNVSIYLLN